MIQANELRIGNFVMTNNSKYRPSDVGKIACITQIDSEKTFEEIGKDLCLTREKVRMIKEKVTRRVRYDLRLEKLLQN